MKYLIEKITDDIFDGFHPNGFDVGFLAKGTMPLGGPVVGERLIFKTENYKPFSTSIVIEAMNEKGIFQTQNSTYKLTQLEE